MPTPERLLMTTTNKLAVEPGGSKLHKEGKIELSKSLMTSPSSAVPDMKQKLASLTDDLEDEKQKKVEPTAGEAAAEAAKDAAKKVAIVPNDSSSESSFRGPAKEGDTDETTTDKDNASSSDSKKDATSETDGEGGAAEDDAEGEKKEEASPDKSSSSTSAANVNQTFEIEGGGTYTDYSKATLRSDPVASIFSAASSRDPTFPVKLHQILSTREFEDIISWLPHGRSFRVLQPKAFEERVIPLFFRHGRYASFARQVNGWGFHRVCNGPDYGAYYHELFLRGLPQLSERMRRPTPGDKKKTRKEISSEPAPNFYEISEKVPLPELPPRDPNASSGESGGAEKAGGGGDARGAGAAAAVAAPQAPPAGYGGMAPQALQFGMAGMQGIPGVQGMPQMGLQHQQQAALFGMQQQQQQQQLQQQQQQNPQAAAAAAAAMYGYGAQAGNPMAAAGIPPMFYHAMGMGGQAGATPGGLVPTAGQGQMGQQGQAGQMGQQGQAVFPQQHRANAQDYNAAIANLNSRVGHPQGNGNGSGFV